MSNSLRIGVTGAHGVGKSTLCKALAKFLRVNFDVSPLLLDNLGASMRARGVPVGSAATAESVAAIYAAHLSRERSIAQGITILDRCAVDALAYVRHLGVCTEVQQWLYEEISATMMSNLSLVVHLRLEGLFLDTGADHESPQLRLNVAGEIERIIGDLRTPNINLVATEPDAIPRITDAIHNLWTAPPNG